MAPNRSNTIRTRKYVRNIKSNSLPFYERIIKCYSNFHFVTYSEFGNPRKDAIEKINSDLIFLNQHQPQEKIFGLINQNMHLFYLQWVMEWIAIEHGRH